MKLFLNLLVVCGFAVHLNGQNSDKAFVFDEFSVSANLTVPYHFSKSHIGNYFGAGLGAYHTFRRDKHFNIMLGLEYNYTSQYVGYMHDSHFSNYDNIITRNHIISIPISARINLGQKTKFFIEPGIFVDIAFVKQNIGDYSYSIPKSDSGYDSGNKKVNELYFGLNAGFSMGTGVVIPAQKIDFLIKADYRFGLVSYFQNEGSIGYARLIFGIRLKQIKEKK